MPCKILVAYASLFLSPSVLTNVIVSVAIAWYGVMFVASFVEELEYKDPTYFFRWVTIF